MLRRVGRCNICPKTPAALLICRLGIIRSFAWWKLAFQKLVFSTAQHKSGGLSIRTAITLFAHWTGARGGAALAISGRKHKKSP